MAVMMSTRLIRLLKHLLDTPVRSTQQRISRQDDFIKRDCHQDDSTQDDRDA